MIVYLIIYFTLFGNALQYGTVNLLTNMSKQCLYSICHSSTSANALKSNAVLFKKKNYALKMNYQLTVFLLKLTKMNKYCNLLFIICSC